MKHTPAPWKTASRVSLMNEQDNEIWTNDRYPIRIAQIDGNSEEQRANAKLIAAAPELLEALLKLMDYTQQGHKIGETHPLEVAENAVRKATNLFSIQIKR